MSSCFIFLMAHFVYLMVSSIPHRLKIKKEKHFLSCVVKKKSLFSSQVLKML